MKEFNLKRFNIGIVSMHIEGHEEKDEVGIEFNKRLQRGREIYKPITDSKYYFKKDIYRNPHPNQRLCHI